MCKLRVCEFASLRVASLQVASFQDHTILKSELPAGDASDAFATC